MRSGAIFVEAGFCSLNVQTVEESVSAQLKVVDKLTDADNGKFFAHTGEEWPGM